MTQLLITQAMIDQQKQRGYKSCSSGEKYRWARINQIFKLSQVIPQVKRIHSVLHSAENSTIPRKIQLCISGKIKTSQKARWTNVGKKYLGTTTSKDKKFWTQPLQKNTKYSDQLPIQTHDWRCIVKLVCIYPPANPNRKGFQTV